MKRVIAILALLTFAFVAGATDLASPGSSSDYTWGGMDAWSGGTNKSGTALSNGNISTSTGYDTIVSTGADTLALNLVANEGGYRYLLGFSDLTGTGADSCEIIVKVNTKDQDKNVIEVGQVADTLGGFGGTALDSTGGWIVLPVNETILGSFYDITVVGGAKNGGQVILNRMWLRKQRKTGTYRP